MTRDSRKTIYLFGLLLLLLTACAAPSSVIAQDTILPARTTTPEPVAVTSLPTDTALPTPDSGIITAQNAGQLEAVRSMGMGSLYGIPQYSPDGKWLAVATTTGVYLYDTAGYLSPRLLTSISDRYIAFSPDGRILAVGNRLISLDNGQLLATFTLVEMPDDSYDWMSDLGFSPDGQQIAIAFRMHTQGVSQDTIRIFRVTDGKLLKNFQGTSVHFSPDGRYLLTQVPSETDTEDRYIRVYDLQNDEQLYDWPGERGGLLPGGWAYVEVGGVVRIYNLETGKAPQTFNGQFAAFSPDGQRMVLLSAGKIDQYQVSDGQRLGTLTGDFIGINQAELRFAPDGQTIGGATSEGVCCGGSQKASFSLWRSDGGLIQRFDGDRLPVTLFEFSPDSASVIFDRIQTNDLQIWRLADGGPQATLAGFTAPVTELAFLPGGEQLVAATYGNYDNPLLIYQVENGQLDRMYPSSVSAPDYGLAVRPDGQVLALSNTFWRLSDGQLLFNELSSKMAEIYPYAAFGVAFSPDGRFVATGASAGNLQLWDFDAQTLLFNQTVCGEDETVTSLSFSSDGQHLALACVDVMGEGNLAVQVYAVSAAGPLQMELPAAPGSNFTSVSYSPDGQYLAAAGIPYSPENYQECPEDSTSQAQVWNAADSRPVVTIPTGCVESLAFSPDGGLLAFGLWDGTIEIWALPAREKIASLPTRPYNYVNALAFSPDGKLLAAGYDDGSVKLWGLGQ